MTGGGTCRPIRARAKSVTPQSHTTYPRARRTRTRLTRQRPLWVNSSVVQVRRQRGQHEQAYIAIQVSESGI